MCQQKPTEFFCVGSKRKKHEKELRGGIRKKSTCVCLRRENYSEARLEI